MHLGSDSKAWAVIYSLGHWNRYQGNEICASKSRNVKVSKLICSNESILL